MIKKLLSAVLIMLVAIGIAAPTNVFAYEDNIHMEGGAWIPNIWINKYNPATGTRFIQQAEFIQIKETKELVYCIQPNTPLSDGTYNATGNWEMVTNMSQAKWTRVTLLAHYGYNYNENGYNHSDSKWYAITQFMIWQTMVSDIPGWDIYFTDGLDGPRISGKFASEMAEIEALIEAHSIVPSFYNSTQSMAIGSTINLNDTNGVLSQFRVESNSMVSTSISGNTLSITANEVGNTTLTLTKSTSKWNTPSIAYIHPTGQNTFLLGDYEPLKIRINLEIYGGKVSIEKVDKETIIAQGDALLSGATYVIYKENGTKVGSITTDSNAKATSGYLPSLGRFYLLEETPSKGYELDPTKYYFDVTLENLYPSVIVKEQIIKRDVNIFKVFASDKTGFLTREPNVQFDIFLKSTGAYYTSIITDESGFATTTLPFGVWVVKQMTTSQDFYKVDDFEITIDNYADSPIYKLLSNSEITARLRVIKIDERGNTIKMAGIQFKIFDITNNKYVCQTITYPTAKEVCIFETDSTGTLMTPYPLNSGKYRLEEQDQIIDGYLWSSDPVNFIIGEDSQLISDNDYGIILKLEFMNKEVKGEINISKNGEELILEDGSFRYEKITLSDVKFGLYADEDIIINGYKYYSKDELVAELISNELGTVSYDNLPLGKYRLVELESSNNHVLNKIIYRFELKYEDQHTAVVYQKFNINNKLPKGKLEITKVDMSTSEPLPNTKICVFTEDDIEIFCGITDENGKIIVEDLFVGRFYLIETEAPEGYILNPEKMWFEITEDGQIIKCTMTNELIVPVPNTESYNSITPGIIGTIFIIGGLIYVTHKKRKK